FFFFQAEDGIRDRNVTGVQTCALPISFNFLKECFEVDNYAVAQHWHGVFGEDAGGQQLEFVLFATDYNGVASIVTTVGLDDVVHASTQMSVALPLPSSPHWAPTITIAAMVIHFLDLRLNTR